MLLKFNRSVSERLEFFDDRDLSVVSLCGVGSEIICSDTRETYEIMAVFTHYTALKEKESKRSQLIETYVHLFLGTT